MKRKWFPWMPQYKIFSGGNQFQWITDGQSIKNSLTCSNSRGHQCPVGGKRKSGWSKVWTPWQVGRELISQCGEIQVYNTGFLDINAMDLRQARADSWKSEGFLAIGLNLAISNHCMMMALIRIIIGDEECYEPFPPFNLSLPPPLQVLSKGTSLATQFNFKPNRPNEKRQIWHIFNWICISDELGIAVTLFFLN